MIKHDFSKELGRVGATACKLYTMRANRNLRMYGNHYGETKFGVSHSDAREADLVEFRSRIDTALECSDKGDILDGIYKAMKEQYDR